MNSEIVRCPLPGKSIAASWDIRRNGRYITSEPTEDAARLALAQLELCHWSFLDCYHSGFAPLELINKVKRARGRICWRLGKWKGRMMFFGSLGDGNQFRYHIFSPQLAETIRAILMPHAAALQKGTASPLARAPATEAPAVPALPARPMALASAREGPAKSQAQANARAAPKPEPQARPGTSKAAGVDSKQMDLF